jgi:hypothetical protein
MTEAHAIEQEKYQVAIQVSVLSYDLNRLNPVVPTLMSQNTLDMLVDMRDELLTVIDEQIEMDGFYAVPDHMDATWLATLMQTELGSYVDVDPSSEGGKSLHRVDPS